MKTKNKIYLGFFLILMFGLVMGLTGIIATQRMAELADEQYAFHEQAAQVAGILGSHYAWRQELCVAVIEDKHFEGSVDSGSCALGKWLASDAAGTITDGKMRALMEQIIKPHTAMHEMAKGIRAMTDAGDIEGARALVVGEVLPLANETIGIIDAIQARLIEEIDAKGGESLGVGTSTRNLLFLIVAFSLVASVVLALLVSGSIMRPIHMIADALGRVSMGALDVQVDYRVNDEIGKLTRLFGVQVEHTKQQLTVAEMLAEGDLTAHLEVRSDQDTMGLAMQKMIARLNHMFGEIDGATEQVSVGALQIAGASQSLAQGSSEQAAAVEELSNSIGEINMKTMKNAEQAAAAAGLAEKIKEDAEQGSRQMDQMMQAVREIGQASKSISKVIKAIDDIAFQTNILSLNAAVEAARAGQHGKGFAVVAEEVRNLASKSAEAARDTGSLIANSIEKAELGARIAGETAASLSNIVAGIKESTLLVGEIANSSEEQREAIRQIDRGIEQVAMVVQQNNATAEQAAAAATQMSEQSGGLRELMSRFRLKNEAKVVADVKKLPKAAQAVGAKRIRLPEASDMGKY